MDVTDQEKNPETDKNSRTMKILITPFHMAPSCLALDSYLPNTNSDHSMMLGSKVWEETERTKKHLIVSSSHHFPAEKWLLDPYCLKQNE